MTPPGGKFQLTETVRGVGETELGGGSRGFNLLNYSFD